MGQCAPESLCAAAFTRKRNPVGAECHDSPGEAKALLDRLLRSAFDRKESSTLLAVQPVNERMGW
jgi:hypothetical protein